MNRRDFELLFKRKLSEGAEIAERKLGRAVPRRFGILRESPKPDGRRVSVEQCLSELFLSDDKSYRIIDLAVVEVSPTTTWVWVRESDHPPASFADTWNQPPGSGPFKHLEANEIRLSAQAS